MHRTTVAVGAGLVALASALPPGTAGAEVAPIRLQWMVSDPSLVDAVSDYVRANPGSAPGIRRALRQIDLDHLPAGVSKADARQLSALIAAPDVLDRRHRLTSEERDVDRRVSTAILGLGNTVDGQAGAAAPAAVAMVAGPGDLPADVPISGSAVNNALTWKWQDAFAAGPCSKSGCTVTDWLNFRFIADNGVNGTRVQFYQDSTSGFTRNGAWNYTFCSGNTSPQTCAPDLAWGAGGGGIQGATYNQSMSNKTGVVNVFKITATDSTGVTRTSRGRTGTAACGTNFCSYP